MIKYQLLIYNDFLGIIIFHFPSYQSCGGSIQAKMKSHNRPTDHSLTNRLTTSGHTDGHTLLQRTEVLRGTKKRKQNYGATQFTSHIFWQLYIRICLSIHSSADTSADPFVVVPYTFTSVTPFVHFQKKTIQITFRRHIQNKLFLDGYSQLYNVVCPSVRPSIGPSVRLSVCQSALNAYSRKYAFSTSEIIGSGEGEGRVQ